MNYICTTSIVLVSILFSEDKPIDTSNLQRRFNIKFINNYQSLPMNVNRSDYTSHCQWLDILLQLMDMIIN